MLLTALLDQEIRLRPSLAGREPSQPVPWADEEPFSQTSQTVLQVGWDEFAEAPEFLPYKIYPIASPYSSIQNMDELFASDIKLA